MLASRMAIKDFATKLVQKISKTLPFYYQLTRISAQLKIIKILGIKKECAIGMDLQLELNQSLKCLSKRPATSQYVFCYKRTLANELSFLKKRCELTE